MSADAVAAWSVVLAFFVVVALFLSTFPLRDDPDGLPYLSRRRGR